MSIRANRLAPGQVRVQHRCDRSQDHTPTFARVPRSMMLTNPLRSAWLEAAWPSPRVARSADAIIVILLAGTVLASVLDNPRMAGALPVALHLAALGSTATCEDAVESPGRSAGLQAGIMGRINALGLMTPREARDA